MGAGGRAAQPRAGPGRSVGLVAGKGRRGTGSSHDTNPLVPSRPFAPPPPSALRAAGFPVSRPSEALFPVPSPESKVGVNPPGPAWWRAGGASAYRLTLSDSGCRAISDAGPLYEPVQTQDRTLPPDRYRWDVAALDDDRRKVTGRRRFAELDTSPACAGGWSSSTLRRRIRDCFPGSRELPPEGLPHNSGLGSGGARNSCQVSATESRRTRSRRSLAPISVSPRRCALPRFRGSKRDPFRPPWSLGSFARPSESKSASIRG